MKRYIDTGIADTDHKISKLLDYFSVQLSDGYWEGEEGFFEEYWNWLDFTTIDSHLNIVVMGSPLWDNVKDIFSKMSDTDVIHYVGNALDSGYSCAGGHVFRDFDDDFIEYVIDILMNY